MCSEPMQAPRRLPEGSVVITPALLLSCPTVRPSVASMGLPPPTCLLLPSCGSPNPLRSHPIPVAIGPRACFCKASRRWSSLHRPACCRTMPDADHRPLIRIVAMITRAGPRNGPRSVARLRSHALRITCKTVAAGTAFCKSLRHPCHKKNSKGQDDQRSLSSSASPSRQRVLPVLLYMAGMFRSPHELARFERDALGRLLRLRGSAMPIRGQRDLHDWGLAEFPNAESACAAELALRARDVAPQRQRLCTLLGRGTEELRPMQLLAQEWDTREPGAPIAIARRDALDPRAASRPVERAVAQALQADPAATRRCLVRVAMDAIAPRWVRKAIMERLTRLLLGDGSEPQQPLDGVTLDAFRGHVRAVSPQGAVKLLRAPLNWQCASHRMHDSVRDGCLFGCAAAADRLEHYVRCVPLHMTVDLFDDAGTGTSISDVYGIGDASDVSSHTAAFRRLMLVTVAYHAVRAARRQLGPQDFEQAVSTARAEEAAQASEVHRFRPHAPSARR